MGNMFLFTYICRRKALGQLQYHLNDFQFFQKIMISNDISTVLVSFCKKIYVNTTCFPRAILCLCNTTIPIKDVFKFKDYPYLYGRSLKKMKS